ncbi:MAG: hypothetical protein FJ265_18950 [Planctomycetes bacterium]|nr:hypothetical protein [Planctomycetota bacterium]
MAFVRWLVVVLGGVLLGVGLALHGQVALARHLRAEVDRTFFLWRALGYATFAFQGGENRMALAMKEVPEEALVESDRAAWVLVAVGGLVTLTGPLLRRRKVGKVGKAGARIPS